MPTEPAPQISPVQSTPRASTAAAGTRPPLIELRKITKTYGHGDAAFRALHGINLTIRQGEFVAIMGHSGSGKSTLMNILGCLDQPTGGAYLYQGVRVDKLEPDQRSLLRRHSLGFIFQGFNLLARTSTVENVEIPLLYRGLTKEQRHADALRALEQVGLGDKLRNTPAELSGGQQQRVAIARAIVTHPRTLLADEPTGNLDTATSREIMELIARLNRETGITVLLVTHEEDVAAYARRIVRITDGRISSDEPVSPAMRRRMLGFKDAAKSSSRAFVEVFTRTEKNVVEKVFPALKPVTIKPLPPPATPEPPPPVVEDFRLPPPRPPLEKPLWSPPPPVEREPLPALLGFTPVPPRPPLPLPPETLLLPPPHGVPRKPPIEHIPDPERDFAPELEPETLDDENFLELDYGEAPVPAQPPAPAPEPPPSQEPLDARPQPKAYDPETDFADELGIVDEPDDDFLEFDYALPPASPKAAAKPPPAPILSDEPVTADEQSDDPGRAAKVRNPTRSAALARTRRKRRARRFGGVH
ncbi:MAG: ABC transporter ATP-binding protein [Puniceicoccales bacterium]|jgi:putative ABC transport system ATP-binding protein|nr:ABC transporter ATP-binding protein [Puniceicoccales bacterium]